MIKQALPALSLVTSENFATFTKSDKVVVVGFFDAADAKSNETFSALAQSQRDDFLFGASNDAALAKAQGIKVPAVVMYKSYDDEKTVYDGKFEEAALQAWTKETAVPIMGEVGPDTYSAYMESGLPLAYVFAETEADTERLTKELLPVAAKYRGKINFATIDAVKFGGHANNLNLYFPVFPVDSIARNNGLRSQSRMLQKTINIHSIRPRKLLWQRSRNLLIVSSTAARRQVSRANPSRKHKKAPLPSSSRTTTKISSWTTPKTSSSNSMLLGYSRLMSTNISAATAKILLPNMSNLPLRMLLTLIKSLSLNAMPR
jgi:thiol-disulfide isomerase/thioredoxin